MQIILYILFSVIHKEPINYFSMSLKVFANFDSHGNNTSQQNIGTAAKNSGKVNGIKHRGTFDN